MPRIYAALAEVSRELVTHRGFEHQEIEFTFESSNPSELFILQSRPMVFDDEVAAAVFEDNDIIWKSLLGTGLGSGGGAYSGRIAMTENDLRMLRERHPEDNILLVRPDTVPEDIRLIVEAGGLLTGRGGGTSHAAITAKKLGKTCVVNCRSMEVNDSAGVVRIGQKEFRSGDWLSIDGTTGNIYEGGHPVKR
jgi:pyruvate,orthophosphate dikinase